MIGSDGSPRLTSAELFKGEAWASAQGPENLIVLKARPGRLPRGLGAEIKCCGGWSVHARTGNAYCVRQSEAWGGSQHAKLY